VGFRKESWVHKLAYLGSQMGMVIANPTDMHENIGSFLGAKMGKSGFPNGEIWATTYKTLAYKMGNSGFLHIAESIVATSIMR
jgi:hypothetical protein